MRGLRDAATLLLLIVLALSVRVSVSEDPAKPSPSAGAGRAQAFEVPATLTLPAFPREGVLSPPEAPSPTPEPRVQPPVEPPFGGCSEAAQRLLVVVTPEQGPARTLRVLTGEASCT